MEPKHSIFIEIDESGKVQATVQGVTGQACSNISKFLDSLGTVQEDRHTDDYWKKPKQSVSIKS
jgi:hypothetical protein